jgi:hypothetical protein
MDNSLCPRCGGGFHCGIDDSRPCACRSLQLDAATLAALRSQFTRCLCPVCLHTLATAPATPENKKAGPV